MQMCIEAMLALDPGASCVFFADVKENAAGDACITEINAAANMAPIAALNRLAFASIARLPSLDCCSADRWIALVR
jgi:hypothetical protein